MSTQVSNRPPGKQTANVYTVMLILSTVFMLIAVIAMIVELRRYAPDYHRTQGAQPQRVSAAPMVPSIDRRV